MLVSLVFLGGMLLGQVDRPADDALRLEVGRAVRRLDAPRLAERDAAERALVEMGPRALDLLPTPDERTGAEVRQRLARIRQKLATAAAESVTRPTRITLHAEAMPLGEIFSAIESQTGNKIVDRRSAGGPAAEALRLPVDFADTPFWPALDEILDRAKLDVYAYGEERAVYVAPRPLGRRPRSAGACYRGPFRIEATSVRAQRDLRRPDQCSLVVAVEVAWEPRFHPISLRHSMSAVRAVDDHGDPIEVETPGANLEIPVAGEATATQVRIPLKLPPRSVSAVARLSGKLDALMQGKVETFTFDDLSHAEKVERRSAGVTVRLEKVRKNHDVWEIRVRVRFDNAQDALASHRNWVFQNEALLIDPAGKEIPYHAFDSTYQSEDEVGVAYFFGIGKELTGYKFVYKTAASVLSRTFEFELEDIKLP